MNVMARDALARSAILVVEDLARPVPGVVTVAGRAAGSAGRRMGDPDGRFGTPGGAGRAHSRADEAAGGRLPSGAGGPRGDEHHSPRPAVADRPDALEDPEPPRAHVESRRGGEHRLQPRAAPHREHPFARGADLQLHLSRIDQVRGRGDRGHRGARTEPPAVEPGGHPGARPPSGPVHESRGARPGLLPRERRGPAADARPDQAAQAPVAGRRDQRRGPAEPQRPGEPRATGPGRDEDHAMPGSPTCGG